LRLSVIPDLSAASLCGFLTTVVDGDAVVHSDGWQGYRHLSRLGYDHRPSSQRRSPAGEWLLPRVHRSISNLKAWLHGTHRDVSREHLQVYLDEFVFRHNPSHTDGRLPDPAGPRHPAPTHDLPPDHPSRRVTALTERTGYAGRLLSQGPEVAAAQPVRAMHGQAKPPSFVANG